MNILYIAYSCDPYQGSEDKIGWNVPVESAKNNNVCVITKEEHRTSVEKYLSENPIENIKFYFIDIPNIYKKLFKGFMYSGRLNIWHKRAFPLAEKICQEKKIDIVHQITPIEFRAIGDYGKIDGIKFVCGPLGGGESIPAGLKEYATENKFIEFIRSSVNKWYKFKLNNFGRLKNCDYIMFVNKETQSFLTNSNTCVRTGDYPILEIAIGKDEIRSHTHQPQNKRVFLVAGRMIYRKGHAFLLDALKAVPNKLDYECRIVGGGPEFERIKAMCKTDSVLKEHVVLTGAVPYADMAKEYDNADVFIMPSLRETTGTVLSEAMANGLPIITINKFGGAVLLDESCAWLYEGTDRQSYVKALADSIVRCIEHPDEVACKGTAAKEKAEQYTWEEKVRYYGKIYDELQKRKDLTESI